MATSRAESFPPSPTWTEKDMPDQTGRVFLITGGTTGIGYSTAKTLYNLNATIYITSRNPLSAQSAITSIISSPPPTSQTVPFNPPSPENPRIHYLLLNLSDLSSIRSTAEEFIRKEGRLDVLFHNAGVMYTENANGKTEQGYHVQLGVNVLGPFLLQHFLTPLLLKTAAMGDTKEYATRVIWVSSSAHRAAPKPDGVEWEDVNLEKVGGGLRGNVRKYAQSKAMGVILAHEFARRYGGVGKGVMSVSLHPGAIKTGLQRWAPWWFNALFGWMRYEARFGGLTLLWAGLREVEMGQGEMVEDVQEGKGHNGGYIVPWGRWGKMDGEIFDGLKERETGKRLWTICEELVKEYI